MTDESDIQLMQNLLIAAGLTVERIPECKKKRCDFRAWDRHEQYLIEVKGVHDDKHINAKLRNGKVYSKPRSHVYSRRVDKSIRKSVKQIRETQKAAGIEDQLRIVVITVRTKYGSDVTARRILGTLYGTRYIIDLGSPHGRETTDCLYFAESAFFRHRRELDAAIVVDATGVMMLLNDHCSRIDRVRASSLGSFFAARGALSAADALERAGRVFVVDRPVDRKDVDAVLNCVAGKYNLQRPLDCSPTDHSVMCRVARSTDN